MSKILNKLTYVLAVGATLAALSGDLYARDRGVNQPGAKGGTAGAGAPGAGVRDPGVNQPGAAGNTGVRDPGVNQPGAAGNVGGSVAARRIVATSVVIATLPAGCSNEVVEETTLYLCDGTYYQATDDGQYAEVDVE